MKTVKIGTQTWSTRNLKVDHYRNGDIIPEASSYKEWKLAGDNKQPAWCYYENKKKKKHGKLYNWYAVNDPRGLAPEGYHIPTIEEFEILKSTVKDDGNSLKVQGIGIDDGIGTNESGFSAVFSNDRYCDGAFDYICLDSSNFAFYWSSTELNETNAHYFYLIDSNNFIYINNDYKNFGFSVRLIKD